MRIREGFVLRQIGDSYVALATGSELVDFDAMISINETGAFLWNNLLEDTTFDELIQKLCGEYDVDKQTASRDVKEFIQSLESAGLLIK
ncbi:MAG: PqqD family protein [Clostridia bacterium]|nr:PqqD family protein [Clostridia bacterium]